MRKEREYLDRLKRYNLWEIKEKKRWLRRLTLEESFEIFTELYNLYLKLPPKVRERLERRRFRDFSGWADIVKKLKRERLS